MLVDDTRTTERTYLMKWLFTALALLLALPVAAQPIHGAPQGVTTYDGIAKPWLTAQCHWKESSDTPNPVGPLVPGIPHTHIEGHFPLWADIGPGPVTVPITVLLFHTKGKVILVQGQIMGPNGPMLMSDVQMDQPFPLVGDPNGIVTFQGHATFDIALTPNGVITDNGRIADAIAPHGWFNTRLMARTVYDNTEVVDTSLWVPYFAMLDPSQPEPIYGEGTMQLRAGCTIAGETSDTFGEHVTEVRGTEGFDRGYLPILAPFSNPFTIYPLTYNYKSIPTFGQYDLRLDANFHLNVAGTVLASTQTEIPGMGVSNVDVLDPVIIANSIAQPGTTPGKHRIAAIWEQESGAGFPGFPPNERLVSVLGFEVEIGPNPTSAPPIIIVPPPPPPPPPAVCQDPKATNLNGPLPCVFPPVVVPVVPTIFEFTCNGLIPKSCILVIK